jgi:hypothetical protein
MPRRLVVSVRKRRWVVGGITKEAWVVDFVDAQGKRRLRTVKTMADAEKFSHLSSAVRSGIVPQPVMSKWFRPVQFTAPLPDGAWRHGAGRAALVEALRSACPMPAPATASVILHLIAELPPRAIVASVDNLLKPVLDALSGIAWVDDAQICELLVRRMPGHARSLKVSLWELPRPEIAPHLNALMDAGLITDW